MRHCASSASATLTTASLSTRPLVHGTCLLAGAAAILTGGDRCGAAMLAAFLALVTPVVYYPLDAAGKVDQGQLTALLKNLMLLGACIHIFVAATDRAKASAGVRGVKAGGGSGKPKNA
jgi:hypothetical protein